MHQTEWKIEKNKKEQERIESQNHKLYLLLPNVKILHRNGNIYELQMHQYQFLPIDVHKDSKNERFIYISIPFDSQRITSRLFLTKNRYCSRVTHHKTQTRPRRNKTLIPHHFLFAPRTIETNYVLFRANFRRIFYFQPLSNNPCDALYVTR